MVSRPARLSAIAVALGAVLLSPMLTFANPLSEFVRFPLGYPVAASYPVDINNDGLWELAITCDGLPTRVGIFSPATGAWLEGPVTLPVVVSSWGAGDYDHDGSIEFAYLKYDSIRTYDPGTGVDSLLWVAPFLPVSAVFWGSSNEGEPLVGLIESNCGHAEYLDCDPYPIIVDAYAWNTHVRSVWSGTEIAVYPSSVNSNPIVSGIATVSGNRLVMHAQHTTVYQTNVVQAAYIDEIYLVDPLWNRSPILDLFPMVGVEGAPPDPMRLTHAAVVPGGQFVVLDMLTDKGIRPCRISCQEVNDASVVWSRSFPAAYYMNFAVYDLHSNGTPELYLPLISGEGWEVRTLRHGGIIDTLRGMPIVDLQTGPLITAGHQDLFYLADSSLYIWGMPTSVNDDQPPPANLPSTPWLTAYPNPFNASIRLTWSPGCSTSTLEILNILGQRIRTYELTTTSIEWDGRDESGRTVPSGIYFACVTGSHTPIAKKLVLLK